MKLIMWRVVVVLNMHTKFRQKWSSSSFPHATMLLLFQTKLLSRLSRKVCRLLSSTVLLCISSLFILLGLTLRLTTILSGEGREGGGNTYVYSVKPWKFGLNCILKRCEARTTLYSSMCVFFIDMQKFPLRMKDNDLLVTELYKDPNEDMVTALSVYLTPKTCK